MGALLAWLASPAGAVVTSVAMTLATWTYHKIRGDSQASIEDTMRGVGKQIVDALVKSGDLTSDALTARAKTLMASAMNALHIPDNAITNQLAMAVVQHAVGDALDELRKLTTTDAAAHLAALQSIVASMPGDMVKAEAEGRARVAPMKDLIDTTPDPAPSSST